MPTETAQKQTKSERRRAAILDAATAAFLENGFGGTTLDDVIRRSGGSRSTVYEQFGDKEGLFAAIITDACDRILAPLSDGIAAGRDPGSTLYGLARTYMDLLMAPANIALYRLV